MPDPKVPGMDSFLIFPIVSSIFGTTEEVKFYVTPFFLPEIGNQIVARFTEETGI